MADLSPEEDSSDLYLENNEEKNLVQINDPTLVKWKDFFDYRFLEYYLKTSLGAKCPVSILAIHNVKNEEAFSRTEDVIKSTLWTYGWYKLKKEHLQYQAENDHKDNNIEEKKIEEITQLKTEEEKPKEEIIQTEIKPEENQTPVNKPDENQTKEIKEENKISENIPKEEIKQEEVIIKEEEKNH